MLDIELIEPDVEARHPLLAIELVGDGTLRKSRDVQPRSARLLVEVVGQADVPPGHTQRIHTHPRVPATASAGSTPSLPAGRSGVRLSSRLNPSAVRS